LLKFHRFANNSCASKWHDLRELVASQDLEVIDPEGKEVTEEFLDVLDKKKDGEQPVGAAWRWIIAVAKDKKVQLHQDISSHMIINK